MATNPSMRLDCLDRAIRAASLDADPDKIIEAAKKFEKYVKGEEQT